MTDDRYGKMADELFHCRSCIDTAISHMTAYIRLLHKDAPPEAFMLGRMLGNLQTLSRMSDDLDNVVDREEEDADD